MKKPVTALVLVVLCSALFTAWGPLLAPLYAGDNAWTVTGLETRQVADLVVSPDFATDETLFAVDPLDNSVFRSTDSGAKWERVAPRHVAEASALAISPAFATDRTVFLGDSRAVYKSISGGDSWKEMTRRVAVAGVAAIALSPDFPSDGVLFIGTEDGVYKSADGGETWQFVGPNALAAGRRVVRSLAVSPAFRTDRTVFVGFKDSGLYKSVDSGATWSQGWLNVPYVQAIVCSPDYARDGTLFAGTSLDGTFVSVDGANGPWRPLSSQYTHALVISPDFASDHTLYAGTGSGVRVSSDSGTTWSNTDSNFGPKVESLAIALTSPRRLYAGAFDAGVFEYTILPPTATPTMTATETATPTVTPEATETPTSSPTPKPTPRVFLPAALADAPIVDRAD